MIPRKKIKVAIVDDHPVVREGLAAMLVSKKDFVISLSCPSGKSLLERAAHGGLDADVLAMDIRMPGLDGLETLANLRRMKCRVKCVLLAGMPLKLEEDRARELGASAYLPKSTGQDELADAIRRTASGEDVFITEDYAETPPPILSAREFEILDTLRRGFTREDTARMLGLSADTVKSYIKSIFHKLDADNIASAISHAYEQGVLRA